jgi:hypothetical protein
MTAVVYIFGFYAFPLRVHHSRHAEAIHDATQPSMPQPLTRDCAFENNVHVMEWSCWRGLIEERSVGGRSALERQAFAATKLPLWT